MSEADIVKRATTRPHVSPCESSQHHLRSILPKRTEPEADSASSSNSNLQKIQRKQEHVK